MKLRIGSGHSANLQRSFEGGSVPVEIIRLTEHNLTLLTQVDEELFDGKIDADRLAACLAQQNHILLVAILDGRIVGQVLGMIHRHPDTPTELYIDDLAVSETVRRRGIATRMLKQLLSIGAESGCEEVWVASDTDNGPAKKFYRSLNLGIRKAVVFEGYLSGIDG
jgi:aminoglycoside 6'-N-acetyltransferase I